MIIRLALLALLLSCYVQAESYFEQCGFKVVNSTESGILLHHPSRVDLNTICLSPAVYSLTNIFASKTAKVIKGENCRKVNVNMDWNKEKLFVFVQTIFIDTEGSTYLFLQMFDKEKQADRVLVYLYHNNDGSFLESLSAWAEGDEEDSWGWPIDTNRKA